MSAVGPLAGRRVLDFSLYLPGPYATRVLADLGADVVRVEPPGGDPVRRYMPGAYEFLHRGKRVLRVDLKRPESGSLVGRLLATADVVVEGFRPGVADRLGFGFAAASAARPGVVHCAISGYGQTGPARHRAGHDIGYEAGGGAFAAAIAAGEPPPVPYLPIADLAGGLHAATSISAALAAAGSASVALDVSLQEVVAHLAIPRIADYFATGSGPDPATMAAWAPGCGVFRTADGGHVALAAVEDRFWDRTCAALAVPELATPPHDDHAARMRDREWLRSVLATRIAALPLAEVEQRLVAAGAPVDRVHDAASLAGDEHLLARGFLRPRPDGPLGVGFPVVADGRRSASTDRLPDPDADRDALLAELAVDDAERRRLRTIGVLPATEAGVA